MTTEPQGSRFTAQSRETVTTGLPLGVHMVSFDRDLRVDRTEPGIPVEPRRAIGRPVAELLGSAQSGEIEQAARQALDGHPATLALRVPGSSGRGERLVRFAPDPARLGMGGLALWVELGEGDAGINIERDRAEEFSLIATVARELARCFGSEEVRLGICEAAAMVCSAERFILFEPDQSGTSLTASASVGVDGTGIELPLNETSGAALALRTNTAMLSADAAGEPGRTRQIVADAIGVSSVLWQPIARGRTVRAVLGVGWEWRIDAVEPRTARLLEVVGLEGAVALDRGGALGRLASMAATDSLTGLPNRRAWDEALERELARAARTGESLAIAMLDLDGFKRFNDLNGHPAGDRLLEQAAGAWKSAVRTADFLARIGGDEFALTLPACDLEHAIELLDRLTRSGPDRAPFSAGVAVWDGQEELEQLVERADRALYEAKDGGRGSIVEAPRDSGPAGGEPPAQAGRG